MTNKLNGFAHNYYSQNGEDGILKELLLQLEKKVKLSKWVCEFGAWDGVFLSNTFFLVENGYNAVYIEGDKSKFQLLLDTVHRFPNITPINKMVSVETFGDDSLNEILKTTNIPKDFDVLSIDIDSFDLSVWESLTDFKPKVVIIEINSSVLPGTIWRHSDLTPGNTFSATINVGKIKLYTAVCHTGNLFFVRNDLIQYISIDKRFIDLPEVLFLYDSQWVKAALSSPLEDPTAILKLYKSFFRAMIKKCFRFIKFKH
jgi:hypothetical protein